MNLYQYLKSKQKKIKLSSSEEYKFYLKNEKILSENRYFAKVIYPEDSFQLVVANIFIRALNNKKAIESCVEQLVISYQEKNKEVPHLEIIQEVKKILKDLPYLEDNDNRIYIPFFSKSLNLIYSNEPDKLLTYPYSNLKDDYLDSLIDPLDFYNYLLFDSFFSKLIKLKEGKSCASFYSIDYQTIYVINNQGRLDNMIPLFDKWMKRIDTQNVLSRAQIVMEHYFNNDRKGFIDELRAQKLISSKMHHKLTKKVGNL